MSSIFASALFWNYTSPSALPDINVWYYAEDGTKFNKTASIANATAVTSWQNAGGLTSHDWNSTGGSRPVFYTNQQNGKGTVRFNHAGGQYLSINPISYMRNLAGVTQFIVFKTANVASGTRICTTTDTNGFRWGQNANTWIAGFGGATCTTSTVPVDTNYHHVALVYDGNAVGNSNKLKIRLDSVDMSLAFTGNVANTTSSTSSTFYGGVDADGSTNFWDGDIAEMMFFTRTLNAGEINTVENYLTTKWSI